MRGIEKIGLWTAGVLIAVAGGLASSDAQAVRYDNIEVTVTPTPTEVSYGAPGSYNFYIQNGTNGTINNVRFRATLSAGEFALANPIGSGAAASCVRVDPQNLDCALTGSLGSFAFSSFDFAFTAPASGIAVSLSWNVRFGQGTATNFISNANSPVANPPDVALISDNTTRASAYIPPDGFNLFTGTALPSVGDQFTVGVLINPANTDIVITGAINESAAPCSLRRCAQLNVVKKAPGQPDQLAIYADDASTDLSSKLVIILRVDASELKGKNIRQTTLFYTPDPDPLTPHIIPGAVPVGPCGSLDPSFVPGTVPCIAKKIEYTKRNAPSPELIGDWEFELWASRNGFVDLGW